ncbi:hypothetical protein Sste5346_000466 [Sporothrix stenoceras]|uniref:Uncharacterized protein n=1 Tax=Sporothrix stenoceras TaxID=5173 RepID=A0ABR3ZR98_9PEZI
MALDDDVGTTLLLSRMDGHTQKQPVGSPMSSQNDTTLKNNKISTPLTSASSPSLSLIPPPLPQRDARRNSCFLDALLDPKTALNTAATATPVANTVNIAGPPTPLDVYLSSEEDASSMGELSDFDFDSDEFDDYDGEFEEAMATTASVVVRTTSNNSAPAAMTTTTPTTSSSSLKETRATAVPVRRHSHDVARVVSVVYAGKPSLVDLGVERAARRRSLHNDRSASSSSSSVALFETRPSTSSGGSMLSTAPSSTVSPAKQHKRNSSSGSIISMTAGGMMASFRARKMAMTNAATVATNTVNLGRSLAPVLTSLDTSIPPPPSPTAIAPSSAVSTTTAPVPTPTMAAPARSFTTSALMTGEPTSAASSPRTPTFGTAGLLRGMTRSLTLSGRRGLGRRESMAEKVSTPTSEMATSPTLFSAMLPAETVSALLAPGGNANNAGNRKSMAMSVVSSMTSMNAPPPGPPNEDGFDENDNNSIAAATPRRLAMPPAEIVVSKKSTGSSFLGSLAGRRRSMKLL